MAIQINEYYVTILSFIHYYNVNNPLLLLKEADVFDEELHYPVVRNSWVQLFRYWTDGVAYLMRSMSLIFLVKISTRRGSNKIPLES
jgi:hypothetical protein